MNPEEIEFLRESNAIEGIYDDASLEQAGVAWDYLKSQPILSPGVVLTTHKILMLNQPLRPNERGYFREIPVYIGGHEAMNWRFIRVRIAEWCNQVMAGSDPILMHIKYEKIHPFVDGNGRTGRMFLNWQRLSRKQPLQIFTEAKRQEYYKLFK